MKWLIMSWRNVWRNRRRSALAISVMAVGVLALLTATGFMLASFHGLREATIRGGLGHLQVRAPEGVIEPASVNAIDGDFSTRPDVRFTMRRLVFEGLVSNGPTTVAVMGSGVDPVKESRLSSGFAPIVQGTGLPSEDEAQGFSALLGVGLAAKLGARPGDDITLLSTTVGGVLNAIDVTVVGTFTTGIPEMDARQVLVRLPAAELLLATKGASRLVVVLREHDDVGPVLAWASDRFPEFAVASWLELAPFYGQVVTLYRNIFTVLGSIILLVVSLSATNTMVMAVTERVQEMGTMLALGISRIRIRANFAMEGAVMGALAGAAGLALALAAALGVNLLDIQMPPPPGRTMPYPLIIFVDVGAYALGFAAMVLTGALSAWLPTGQLQRLPIIDALRRI